MIVARDPLTGFRETETRVSSYTMVAVPLRKLASTFTTPPRRSICFSTPASSKMDIIPSMRTVISFIHQLTSAKPSSTSQRKLAAYPTTVHKTVHKTSSGTLRLRRGLDRSLT
jgi:hypothetical protein